MSPHQKLAAYPHLYSFTSTKSIVHWFQIIRNKSFQMYDDDSPSAFSISASDRYYKVAKFPTRNIKTPIVLVYGGSDSLVDIKVMLRELPKHTMAFEIKHFEHLDFLWAQGVDKLVFPHVFNALIYYSNNDTNGATGPNAPGLSFARANTARLRAGSGSVSSDDRSLSDLDGAMDTPTPSEKRKSAAQVARERHYLTATAESLATPDSPISSWDLGRPSTRKPAESNNGKFAIPPDPSVEVPASPSTLAPPFQSQNLPPDPSKPLTPQSGSDSEAKKPPSGDESRLRNATRERAGSTSSQGTAGSSGGSGVSAPRFGNLGIRLGTSRPSVSVADSSGMQPDANDSERQV